MSFVVCKSVFTDRKSCDRDSQERSVKSVVYFGRVYVNTLLSTLCNKNVELRRYIVL